MDPNGWTTRLRPLRPSRKTPAPRRSYAALALADIYKTRCPQDANREAILAAYTRWKNESTSNLGENCLRGLLRGTTIVEAANNYPSVCLKSREAGKIESFVLEHGASNGNTD